MVKRSNTKAQSDPVSDVMKTLGTYSSASDEPLSDRLFPPPQPELLEKFRTVLRESKALDSFIGGRLQETSIEIERAGTPKGDPLPFSRKKTRAALLHLKLEGEIPNLEALASEAGISYSLLGKWRTETRFKDAVTNYQADFSTLMVGFVLAWIAGHEDLDAPGILDVGQALAIISDMKKDSPRWSPELRRSFFLLLRFALERPQDFPGGVKKMSALDRIVAILIGCAICKGAMLDRDRNESYRMIRDRASPLVDDLISKVQKSIRGGDARAAYRGLATLKALTYSLVSPEIWPA